MILSRLLLLIKKDVQLEFRTKETLVLLISSGLLISGVVGAGVSATFLNAETVSRIFPMLLWVVFLLVSTTAVFRSHDSELEGHAFEGLLLAGVSPALMYLAKFIAIWCVLFVGFVVIDFSLVMLLGMTLTSKIWLTFLIAAPVTGSYSALIALLIGVSSTAQLKGVILPIIAIPLFFPIFFAATELTANLVLRGELDLSSPWFSILVVAWTLYVLAGVNLYEYVIRE